MFACDIQGSTDAKNRRKGYDSSHKFLCAILRRLGGRHIMRFECVKFLNSMCVKIHRRHRHSRVGVSAKFQLMHKKKECLEKEDRNAPINYRGK